MDEAINVLWLYASNEVMKYVDEYLFSQKPTTLDKDHKLSKLERPAKWIMKT